MKNVISIFIAGSLIGILSVSCGGQAEIPENGVWVGLDVLLKEEAGYLDGKKVGIITNNSAVTLDGRHIIDVINELANCEVVALYGPEHGIRGALPAGVEQDTYVDEKTGIKVWSLYGEHYKPTPEMLEGVDLLIYDIPNVGVRFYTYISTMGLAMEAAAEEGIPFCVLDRPNPITGTKVEGPVLDMEFQSFVGKYPIPIRYGLSTGELATMVNEEGWLENGVKCDLTIIKMKGWDRTTWLDEIDVPWIKPSPNIPDIPTAEAYVGTCLIEGTNISEARGTMTPFLMAGAPYIDGNALAEKMNGLALPGVTFEPVTYTPVSIEGMATRMKYQNEECSGVRLNITDRATFNSAQAGIYLIHTIKTMYPDKFQTRGSLNRLYGGDAFAKALEAGTPADEIIGDYQEGLERFKKIREKYLMY